MLQQPALDSDTAHTNQKLNNITLAQVDGELTRIRNGNARTNFSEYNGKLMYTDARGRREVLPVEHRDRVFGELHKRHGYPGVRRFHSLVERQYAGVSRWKLEWWYGSSANNQIHAQLKSKTTVRPVYAHDPLRHLQCDLVDFQSRPSGRHKWIFCYIDVSAGTWSRTPRPTRRGPRARQRCAACASSWTWTGWVRCCRATTTPASSRTCSRMPSRSSA